MQNLVTSEFDLVVQVRCFAFSTPPALLSSLQLRQRCYHTAEGNVRCSPLSGGHNTRQNSIDYAYGAGKEGYATDSCPSGYKYLGRVCTLDTLYPEENYATASQKCAGLLGTVYYSPTKEQNLIFNAVMTEKVGEIYRS